MFVDLGSPAAREAARRVAENQAQTRVHPGPPEVEDFDSSFVQATALNPQLVVLLDQAQLNSAKNQIEKAVRVLFRVKINSQFQLSDRFEMPRIQ